MDRQVGVNATPHLRGETNAGPAWRVLVADDEPPLRLLCRAALEYDGFIVLEARDGIEALELARLGSSACSYGTRSTWQRLRPSAEGLARRGLIRA